MNTHLSDSTSDTTTTGEPRAGYGFMQGTLVHTQTGTKPIERVEVGELVLSRQGPITAPVYKRVTRTFNNVSNMLCLVRCHKLVDGNPISQNLIVTAEHPFYVVGQQKEEWQDDDSFAYIPKYSGWRNAEFLSSWDVVLLANGDTIRVSMTDRIWRTKQEGIGWISANPDGDLGHRIDLRGGQITEEFRPTVLSDFIGVGTFGIRYETPELQAEWGYTCAAYNLEVEDFCSYHVGELGVWVRDGQSNTDQS